MLFVDRSIHTPLKPTNSLLGSKVAQAAEDRFPVLQLARSTYPTNDSKGLTSATNAKADYLTKKITLDENKNVTKSYKEITTLSQA